MQSNSASGANVGLGSSFILDDKKRNDWYDSPEKRDASES